MKQIRFAFRCRVFKYIRTEKLFILSVIAFLQALIVLKHPIKLFKACRQVFNNSCTCLAPGLFKRMIKDNFQGNKACCCSSSSARQKFQMRAFSRPCTRKTISTPSLRISISRTGATICSLESNKTATANRRSSLLLDRCLFSSFYCLTTILKRKLE